MRLLRTPIQYDDESLMGYIIRLSEANGYDNPQWILQNAGWRINLKNNGTSVFYRSSLKYSKFNELTGKTTSKKSSNQPKEQLAPNDLFSSEFLIHDYSRFCPACLREVNYYKNYWDLISINVCPIHLVVLVDACPKCHQKIRWNRNKVSTCPCGYDLQFYTGERVSEKEARYCQKIWKCFGLAKANDQPISNPLNSLSLETYLEFIFLWADILAELQNRKNIKAQSNEIIYNYLKQVYQSFDEFPQNIGSLFNSVFNSDNGAKTEIINRLRYFCENDDLFFLLLTLDKYLTNPESPEFSGNFLTLRNCLLTFEETMEILKLDQYKLFEIVKKGLIPRIYLKELCYRPYFHQEDIEELRQYPDKFISEQQMRKILEVDRQTFSQLLEFGVISPTNDPVILGLRLKLFEEKQLDNILSKIRNQMKPGAEKQDEIKPFQVLSMLEQAKENIGLFVQNVLSNEIQPIREVRATGLLRFSFSQKVIKNYIKLHQKKANKAKQQSKKELMSKLKRLVKSLENIQHKGLMSPSKRRKEMEFLENNPASTVEEIRMVAKRIFKLRKNID
ncbi:MAG TPA: TniQ family protein [Pyrinomonadaceae bacterium]|nr:TniQ family protein [Pyrinomonadaceae bacterium]